MNKCCKNCGLYMRIKGNTSLGKVYYCNPKATKFSRIIDNEFNFCCKDWKEELPEFLSDLFGGFKK